MGKLRHREFSKVLSTVSQYYVLSCPMAQGSTSLTHPLPFLPIQGTHPLRSSGSTTGMRSRSQRTSTLNRQALGTAFASRRCSRRTQALTPVKPGTALERSAPRPCSRCKVRPTAGRDGRGGGAAMVSPKVIWRQGLHVCEPTLFPPGIPAPGPAPNSASQALAEWGCPPLPSEVPALSRDSCTEC